MIEKYTPLMRERNANQPNTKASSAGTNTTSSICSTKESDKLHVQGRVFQFRNTMKSGNSLL